MPSATTLGVSHSPSCRGNALISAYEAILEAKAMLRGEQSPYPTAQDPDVSSPGPSSSPPQTRSTESCSNNRDGALAHPNSYGLRLARGTISGGSTRNGCDTSSAMNTPPRNADIGISSLHRVCSPSKNRPAMLQDVETTEKSLSPEAQPPAPMLSYRFSSEGEKQARGEQHVRFSVPTSALEYSRRSSRCTKPSPSPPPVPPSVQNYNLPKHIVSEVDVRTVALLQCLSYEEVQHVCDSLSRSDGWDFPGADSTSGNIASTTSTVANRPFTDNWVTQPTTFSWDAEAPVLLDVDAQLRYAVHFYSQLTGADDEMRDNGFRSNEVQKVKDDVEESFAAGASSSKSLSGALKSLANEELCKAAGAVVDQRQPQVSMDDDGELTLSPIANSLLSNSPVRHPPEIYGIKSDNVSEKTRSHHYPPLPPPSPADQLFCISPRNSLRTSSALRPQIILTNPKDQRQVHRDYPRLQQQHRPQGRQFQTIRKNVSPQSRHAIPPAEYSLTPSTSSSRIAIPSSSWRLADFDVGRRLGSGETGRTYLAREKRSKVVVALKCVEKSDLVSRFNGDDIKSNDTEGIDKSYEDDRLPRRIRRAARLHMSAGRRCPHISKLYTFFEDARRVFLTLEYADDGDLASYAARQPNKRLPEAQLQRFVCQLTLALAYLHTHQIAHGAVMPRHVLLKDNCTNAKLSSFLNARRLCSVRDETEDALSQKENVDYAAPEVVRGRSRSSTKADMWALGVLTYELLCGYLPFEHVSTTQAKHLICTGVVYYPKWMSAKAKSFVRSLLCVEETTRCSATEALEHPFLFGQQAAFVQANASKRNSGVSKELTVSANLGAAVPGGEESNGKAFTTTEFRPISRDLSVSFSLVEDESHVSGAPTAESALSLFGAVSTTSFLPLAGCTSNMESLTISPSTSPSRRNNENCSISANGDNEDESASTSTVSTVPTSTTATSTGMSANSNSPFTFLNFALPSHSWRSSTQPYGTAATHRSNSGSNNYDGHNSHSNGALPSVMLTSPPSVSSLVAVDEAGTRLQRRSSATSMKSAALSSRPSLNTTLSDVSASFLSTTCAPTGAAALVLAADGLNSSSKSNNHQLLNSSGNNNYSNNSNRGITFATSSPFLLADYEARVPCSVTVSSLTAVSPSPRSEWASALDVEVSASSSAFSSSFISPTAEHDPQSEPLILHEAMPSSSLQLRSAEAAETQKIIQKGELDVAQRPRFLPALSAVPNRNAATAASTSACAKGKKIAAVKKKKTGGDPECAMRLDFDCLSDDDW